MEKGWTMGGGGAGRVWATYEAKPGNLGLRWNKKNSCREQNPLVESEGSGRAAGEAAPWCQRGFGWGRGGGDATAAGTRLSRLRGSRCAPSAQRCSRAGQSRSRHIPRELLLGSPREPQLRLGRDRRADAGQGLSPVVASLCGGCRWLLSGAQGTRTEPLRPLWAGNRSSKSHLQGALGAPRLLSFLETAPCRGSCSHCPRDVAPAEINTEINSGTPAGDPSLPSCHGPAHQGTNAPQVSPAPAELQRIQLWPLSLSGGAPLQPWQGIYG